MNSDIPPVIATNQYANLEFFFECWLDVVNLYNSGCPGTNFVDLAGLELRDCLASASQMLEIKLYTPTTWQKSMH